MHLVKLYNHVIISVVVRIDELYFVKVNDVDIRIEDIKLWCIGKLYILHIVFMYISFL